MVVVFSASPTLPQLVAVGLLSLLFSLLMELNQLLLNPLLLKPIQEHGPEDDCVCTGLQVHQVRRAVWGVFLGQWQAIYNIGEDQSIDQQQGEDHDENCIVGHFIFW